MTATAGVIQGQESAFPKSEYDARVEKARAGLVQAGIDVMIVTGPENIFYLTGQQTPGYYTFQALILPVDGDPVFVVRQLEYFNFVANTFISDAAIYQDTDDPVRFLVALIEARGLKSRRVAIDKRGWFLPIATYEALVAALGAVHDAAGVVEKLRAVKSPLEVEKLVMAAGYVDAGMRAGLAAVRVGNTENDIVAAMMGAAIGAGSEYMGMEPLVSSGPRSGVPHGTWRRRELRIGDPAFLEMAAVHDRYHAALMRLVWIGTPPTEALDMMKVCQEALSVSLEAIRPGVPCEVPHNACQKVIDAAGYTDNFRKRLGYSVGISFAPDWGEGSILSLNAGVKTLLEPGMAFHLPPALRVFGRFTVGVSETIVVTETGCRVLGTLDRALLEVAV
ncbi:M24 family metallopeptidase [Ancylobacter terrae]|uniref:M24 family metallopeptidase n=1 Tax=Ancylobacter sp. sgz301288 TaxID=3342077 RepID=UPI00385F1FCC